MLRGRRLLACRSDLSEGRSRSCVSCSTAFLGWGLALCRQTSSAFASFSTKMLGMFEPSLLTRLTDETQSPSVNSV